MSKNWYILQTYAGYEDKIDRTLNLLLAAKEIDPTVLTGVKVPVEEVVEIRKDSRTGKEKKVTRRTKILPGYIMLEMDLPELGWKDVCAKIRALQGVGGFVGTSPSERPRPISADEAKALLQKNTDAKGEKTVKIRQNYAAGDRVKITKGMCEGLEGVIETVIPEKEQLIVTVQIFGRGTNVTVGLTEVEKAV